MGPNLSWVKSVRIAIPIFHRSSNLRKVWLTYSSTPYTYLLLLLGNWGSARLQTFRFPINKPSQSLFSPRSFPDLSLPPTTKQLSARHCWIPMSLLCCILRETGKSENRCGKVRPRLFSPNPLSYAWECRMEKSSADNITYLPTTAGRLWINTIRFIGRENNNQEEIRLLHFLLPKTFHTFLWWDVRARCIFHENFKMVVKDLWKGNGISNPRPWRIPSWLHCQLK